MPPLIPENSLKRSYRLYIKDKSIALTRISSTVVLVVLPYFIYEDAVVHNLSTASIVLRCIPLVLATIVLISVLSPLKKFKTMIIAFYVLLMLGLMIMSSGLMILTAETRLYYIFVMGTVVVIFCIYAGSVYGMYLLIPAYGIPLAGVTVYFLFFTDVAFDKIFILSNPIATAIVCIILSQIQGKLRFNEFKSEMTVDLQNKQLNHELELARAVQNNLIPTKMPEFSEVSFAALYHPMIEIGGDFYDFIRFNDDRRIGIFICDVSGHGVSAALIASMFKTLITTSGDHADSPASMLQYMNRQLIGQTNGHFITAFYGIYDIEDKSFFFGRAGHTYPLLIRNGSGSEIKSKGVFLGMVKNIIIEEKKIALEKGDRVIFYTDGLTETRDQNKAKFEELLFSEMLTAKDSLDIEEYVRWLYHGLLQYRTSDDVEDDVCVVGMDVQ